MASNSMVMSPSIFFFFSSSFFFFFFLCMGLSSATVHTVGGAKGWTTMNPPNYTALAAMETFHVGDTLLFVYYNKAHNVLEVNKSDYDACTSTSPIMTYTTGNDSINIATAGDYYFLCGFPGHCLGGQKFGFSTVEKSSEPNPSPSPSTTPSTPSKNVASALVGREGLGSAVLAVLAVASLVSI